VIASPAFSCRGLFAAGAGAARRDPYFYADERNPDEIKAPWAEADERVAAARCAAGV
jgi:hypothetical protein